MSGGPKAVLTAPKTDFRSSPNNGHHASERSLPKSADIVAKSKIEQPWKSRESWSLGFSAAASLFNVTPDVLIDRWNDIRQTKLKSSWSRAGRQLAIAPCEYPITFISHFQKKGLTDFLVEDIRPFHDCVDKVPAN
jgi:hypothetical protein